MDTHKLKGRKLTYEVRYRYAKGKDWKKTYNTACTVLLQDKVLGKNLESVLKGIRLDDLDELEFEKDSLGYPRYKGAIFGQFKYVHMMSQEWQKRWGLEGLDFDKKAEEFRERRWKISGQRSIILKLDEPIDGFKAVKIKGRCYVRLMQPDDHQIPEFCPVVMAPYSGFGFSSPVQQFDKKGRLIGNKLFDHGPARPHGGMLGSKAKQELLMTEDLLCKGLPVCLPIGAGVHTASAYKPNRYVRERPAFVILGIRDTMDYRLPDTIFHARERKDFKDFTDHVLQEWGRTVRRAHDLHYFLGMPHIENASFDDKGILLHDLDTAEHKKGLTSEQDLWYRLREIECAGSMLDGFTGNPTEQEQHASYEASEYGPSGISLRSLAHSNLTRVLNKKKVSPPLESFIHGYFGKHVGFSYPDFKHGFGNLHNLTAGRKFDEIKDVKHPNKSRLYIAMKRIV